MDNNQNKFIQSDNNLQSTPGFNPNNNDIHQHDNDFLNHINTTNTYASENNNSTAQEMDELKSILKPNKNKFINNDLDEKDASFTSLNIDEASRVDYSRDPKVQENLNQYGNQQAKKNTISIGSEGIVFLVIIALLLVFIFVLPTIFDFIKASKLRLSFRDACSFSLDGEEYSPGKELVIENLHKAVEFVL